MFSCLVPVPAGHQQTTAVRGLEYVAPLGSLRVHGNVSCWVPVPAGLLMDCGWEGQLLGLFRIYSQDRLGGLISRISQRVAKKVWSGLTGHFRVHSQDWGLWVWLFLGPLVYGADDRVKPNEAVAESSGIKSCFHSVAGTTVSDLATCVQSAFSKWLSSAWTMQGFHILPPGSKNFHKGTSVHGWLPNYYCRRGTQAEDLLFSHLVDPFLLF